MTRPSAQASTDSHTGPDGTAPASITVQRRIEWSDTDASGHWHNTAAFRWIEVAETTLFQRLGLLEEIYGRLPRVSISAEFKTGLRHKDLVDIELWIAGLGRTSVTYGFRMTSGGAVATEGTAVAVLLDRPGGNPVAWPEEHRKLLLEGGPQRGEKLVSE